MQDEISKTILALDGFVKHTKEGFNTINAKDEFDLFNVPATASRLRCRNNS